MNDAVIETRGLRKTFGSTVALDDLSLRVEPGQVHGFLGPNGSGKSTTLRVLLGLLRKDAGEVTMLGGDPWAQAAELHRRLAYVPGDVSLWPNLTGGEAIDLIGRARGGLDSGRRAELVERFDLDVRKKGRSDSKGNRQKVSLVAALAADAELLLLDEPTSGLDPLMERVFTECVREERDRGRTILLSSHILSEVEALCDRVSIVKAGRIVESGTLADLRHLSRTQVSAETAATVDVASLPGVHDVVLDGSRLSCQVEPAALPALLSRLADSGVRSLTSAPPTLEELFLRHYGEDSATRAQAPGAA